VAKAQVPVQGAPELPGTESQQASAHSSGDTSAPAGEDPWSGKIVIS